MIYIKTQKHKKTSMKCPKCESIIHDGAKFCEFCGHHFTKLDEYDTEEAVSINENKESTLSSEMQLSPFYTRLLSNFIDLINVILLSTVYISLTIENLEALKDIVQIQIVFGVSTFIYWSSMELIFGRTMGKMITKTKIIQHNGLKPSLFQTLLRVSIICICILTPALYIILISFAVSFFTKRTVLGLHDLITKTLVIYDK